MLNIMCKWKSGLTIITKNYISINLNSMVLIFIHNINIMGIGNYLIKIIELDDL